MRIWNGFLVSCLLLPVVALAGQYEFSSEVIAGAPGSSATPTLSISFRGDAETLDTQIGYFFDNTLFTVHATARNGAICLIMGNRIRIISPGSSVPLPSNPVLYCELSFDIGTIVADGSYSLTLDPSVTECYGLEGASAECLAPSGTDLIHVGSPLPLPALAYSLDAGSTLTLAEETGEIGVVFVPGGGGASIQLQNCSITSNPGANFDPVILAPEALSFGGSTPNTGVIGIGCTSMAEQTSGLLQCEELINGDIVQPRSWSLVCPALPSDVISTDGFES